jgi:hypothetical protein
LDAPEEILTTEESETAEEKAGTGEGRDLKEEEKSAAVMRPA